MSRILPPPGRRGLLGLAAAAAFMPRRGMAHDGHAHPPRVPQADAVTRLKSPLPDVRVTDAQRRRRRLVSEVLAGRVVAIDFVLTDCTTFCAVISAAMAGAQELMGPRLREQAGLVSLALDPVGGTPEQLRDYAARFGARPDWSFLSMPQEPLEQVLRGLGGPVAGSDHAPMVVVLDSRGGEIRRLFGMPAPEAIVSTMEAALAARKA
ncbi:SCO family protein [Roseomonas marmotae]|uniref:SCO family protein n=1 Tax=Roseomonas marmotae TaxID=2768161 RepID=A0ABS3KEC8_9PROT|nr:SCO family protein [Roseomonas marmotae]MBO1075018.1 SCO family protein [Roseomonas marmotae]QTI79946.1 SCO family protein [Roseomonas marmotae]